LHHDLHSRRKLWHTIERAGILLNTQFASTPASGADKLKVDK
jgi:hypothetical protein